MKNLVFYLVLFIGINIFSQNTTIPDMEFEHWLETHDSSGNVVPVGNANSLGNGTDGDHIVPTSKINSLLYLDISSGLNAGGIQDLTGIQDFTLLENFDCSGHQIATINLTQNTNLKILNISHNNITSINLTQNTLLERFSCDENLLTNLNLSQNTSIYYLNISNNPFTTNVNVSSLTYLSEYYCQNANQTALNLSSNTLLTKLFCDNPDLQNKNALTSLNLSNNSILVTLVCRGNSLTSITMPTNDVFGNPPSLSNIACENNHLSSLNLNNLPNLTSLTCGSNLLTSLDLSQNHNFNNLNFENNSNLQTLNIKNGNNSNITSLNFVALNVPLLTCVTVDNVNYSTTVWTQRDSQIVFNLDCSTYGLTYVPDSNFENYLETHDASGNVVSVGSANSLGNGILNDHYVTTAKINVVITLNVSNLNIVDLTGIEDFTALTNLNCSQNSMQSLNVSNLSNLQILNCANNTISILQINNSLHNLNASYNQLTSFTLQTSTQLTECNLQNNSLTTVNVNQSTGLQTLILSNNQLTSLSVNLLGNLKNLICKNNFLTQLYVSQNIYLNVLDCQNNSLTALNLEQNQNLTSIDCNTNHLDVLNIKNGANTNIIFFDARFNGTLSCIEVDDVAYANTNFTNIDATTSFSLDCHFYETYVPDDNFEHYLETHDPNGNLVTVGDASSMGNGTDYDDYVTTSNISNVLNLNVYNKSISDLTGIENFTSLVSLSCDDNQLSSLNVSTLTNLRILDCSYNQISSINLNNNTLLENLNIFHNNLTSLDLSHNTALKTLECGANQLTTLSVSNNTALQTLRAEHNQITAMLTTSNGNLTQLLISYNKITEIDISSNTHITWFEATNNLLTQADLRNGNYTNMSISLINNPNLTCVEVDDVIYALNHWLNDIDITATYSLDCHYGQTYVPDDNFEQRLIDLGYDGVLDDYVLTASIENITSLDIDSKNIYDMTGIEAFTALQNLYMGGNSFTSVDLSHNFNLKMLYARNGQLENLDVSNNSMLTYLDCGTNNLQTLNVKNGNNTNFTYFRALNNPQLTCIQVDNPTYSTANWTLIDATASFNTNCHIGETYVPDDNFEQALIDLNLDSGPLDDYVPNNTISQVFSLNVSNKNISDLTGIKGFTNLLELRCGNNNLTTLDLTYNSQLGKLICSNNQLNYINITNCPYIYYLDCSSNALNSIDVSANNDLITFNCSANQLTSISISSMSYLTYFICYNNLITYIDVSQNTYLERLECGRNKLVILDVSNNVNLVDLYASQNLLTSLDVHSNTNLINLDCSVNNLSQLNVKNGNNTNFNSFKAFTNSNLTCIEVDNPTWSTTNWTDIDAIASFNTNCSYPVPTIWQNGSWSNGIPTINDYAIIRDNYITGNNGNLTSKTLTIDPTYSLSISSGDYVKIQGNLINNGLLQIEPTGSFVQVDDNAFVTGNGTFNVQINTTTLQDGDRFTYFSSPTQNENLNVFNTWANINRIWNFNATAQQWNLLNGNETMIPGDGYAVKPNASTNIFPFTALTFFSGYLNNGVITKTLVYNPGGNDDDNIFIGNPYPSAVDAAMLLNQNSSANAFYFWTHKSALGPNGYLGDDYAIWNNSGGIASASGSPAPTGYIASGQGFFATASANGTITFNNAMRTTTNNNDFRRPDNTSDKIWINLTSDEGNFSQTLIAFIPQGTDGFDPTYDATRLNSGANVVAYFIGQNNEHFGIDARAKLTGEKVLNYGIEIQNTTNATFTIAIDHLENFENATVFLRDNLLNVVHNLKQSDYTFTTNNTGEINNRFELWFNRSALSINENTNATTNIIIANTNDNLITVQTNDGSIIKQIKVYDILGKLLVQQSVKGNTSTTINLNVNEGTILFVNSLLEDNTIITKKIVK